jgi:hypothetical protein
MPAGRLDAVPAALQPGDVLVGHSGAGVEITRAADAAPELGGHVIYLAAALPLEGLLMQESLVYRDASHSPFLSRPAELA